MADTAVRREARRRKILENSESRLKRLTTLEAQTAEGAHIKPYAASDVSNRKTVSFRDSDEFNVNQVDGNEILIAHRHRDADDINTIFQNPRAEDTDSVSEIEFDNFDEIIKTNDLRLWVIIILALLVRYLLLIYEQYIQLKVEYVNKIFFPLLAYELIELVFFKPPVEVNSFIFSLLVLNNARPAYATRILKCWNVISRIMQDMLIYFFVFTTFDGVLNLIMGER